MATSQKFSVNQKGLAPIILILLAAIGLILYLLISNTFSFKEGLFSLLYPKPVSKAGGGVIPIIFKSSDGEILPVNAANIPITQSADVKIELTSTLGSPQPSPAVSSPINSSPSSESWTQFYRIAESSEELDKAQYEPYTEEPTIINYTFDDVLGSKYIWVEFKDSNSKTDRKAAQIELISAPTPTPKPSSTKTSSSTPTPTPKPTSTPSPKPTPKPSLKPTPAPIPTLKPVPIPTPAKLSPKPVSLLTPVSPSKTALLVSPSPATTLDNQNLQTKDKNCGIFCGFGRLVEGINKVLERGMEQILRRIGILSDE